MRNHTRVRTPPDSPIVTCAAPRPTALARIGVAFGSIIAWLRAGYPDDAPGTGYSPLLALNGPVSLSARQTARIVRALGDGPAGPIDIAVAITKATDRLPTQGQTRTVAQAIAPSTTDL
jgi:hypothetical protein